MNFISTLINIGTSPEKDEELNKTTRVLNSMCLILLVSMIVWIIIALIYAPYLNLNLILFYISLTSCFITFYLNYKGWINFSIWFSMVSYYLCMTGHIIVCGNQYNHQLLYLFGIFLPFFFSTTKSKYMSVMVSLYFLSFLYFQFLFIDSNRLIKFNAETSIMMHNAVNTTLYLGLAIIAVYVALAINDAESRFQAERIRAEELLYNILPQSIALRLSKNNDIIADSFVNVSVLFADVVGFTPYSNGKPPKEIVNILNSIFSQFDEFAEKYELEKIKTIGDSYMVASGIPFEKTDHAERITEFALSINDYMKQIPSDDNFRFILRIGINSGPVVAGVIGKRKFIYDLWGDSVNTASRMESHGLAGEIQITEQTYKLIKDKFDIEPRGMVEIKGKGLMSTFLVKGRKIQYL